MFYVIKKHGTRANGGYVQREGSHNSYGGLVNARRFNSRASALRDACGNESIVEIR